MNTRYGEVNKFIGVTIYDRDVMDQYLGKGNWKSRHVYVVHFRSHFDDVDQEELQERKAFFDTIREAQNRANPPGTPTSEWTHFAHFCYWPLDDDECLAWEAAR